MNRTIFILSAATLLCFAACDKEKAAEPAAATTPPVAPSAAAAPTPAPAPATTAATAGTIPVAADFEEEAEKSITKANYKTELSSLEAEIK